MTVSERRARYYASAPGGVYLWECVALSHPEFTRVYRFTNRPLGLDDVRDPETGAVVSFEHGPITIQQPRQDGQGRHEMPVVIAVTREAVLAVESASSRADAAIVLKYYEYFEDDLDPAADLIRLELTGVEINPSRNTISGAASMPDLARRPFPRVTYTVEDFPGLDRS